MDARTTTVPLLKISHLLAFMPLSAGSCSRSSSNRSFISFLRFLSASLCETRSSGEREYGVEPSSFGEPALAPSSNWMSAAAEVEGPGLLTDDWSEPRTREDGRERDLRTRVGPVEAGVCKFSVGPEGADIRRSGENATGGMMESDS